VKAAHLARIQQLALNNVVVDTVLKVAHSTDYNWDELLITMVEGLAQANAQMTRHLCEFDAASRRNAEPSGDQPATTGPRFDGQPIFNRFPPINPLVMTCKHCGTSHTYSHGVECPQCHTFNLYPPKGTMKS